MAELPNRPDLPPGQGVPAHLQQLFRRVDRKREPYLHLAANQYGPSVKRIYRGNLIWFRYVNYRHDPFPLVIITDIWQNYIRGINLHYLTFYYVKKLLNLHCDNMMFSYFLIKHDRFMKNAFRTYKRLGIKQVRKLDCSFLLNVLGSVMSFDPAEVEQMRVYVKEQLRRQFQPRAEAVEERYMGMVEKGPEFRQPMRVPLPPETGEV